MKSFSEKFIYHIWDGFHFINPLITESGKKLEVIFQGRWNTSAGPDFLNAVIKIENQLLKGDIEIHKDTYDWKKHSHDEDKNYNEVILHVVFKNTPNSKYTITENGKKVEIVNISHYLDENIKKLFATYKDKDFKPTEKFCYFFAGETKETINILLTRLGLIRLEKKIKRFNAELTFRSFDQVFYSAILETAGYSKNKFQMIKAAEVLSFSKLKSYYKKEMDLDTFISIFLVATNLINMLPSTFPIQFKTKWIELFNKNKFEKVTYDIEWEKFRIRPVNNPAIRFLQIAPVIFKGFEIGLADYLFSIFSIPEGNFSLKFFKKRLYDFFSENLIIPQKYKIGKSRIDIILINIIIPLSIIYADKMGYEKLKNTVYKIYQEFHGLPNNFILDFMKNFMDSNQRKLINKKSVVQQGLLNLYYSFCNKHLCNFCKANKEKLIKSS